MDRSLYISYIILLDKRIIVQIGAYYMFYCTFYIHHATRISQVSIDYQVFKFNRILFHTQILLLKIMNFEVDVLEIISGKVLPF